MKNNERIIWQNMDIDISDYEDFLQECYPEITDPYEMQGFCNEMNDIYLDDDGICYFSDILMDYFGKKATLDIYRYVKALNKYSRHEYEFDCIFKSLSVKELKELESKYLKYEVVPEQEEAKQDVIDRIRAELKSRKRIWI